MKLPTIFILLVQVSALFTRVPLKKLRFTRLLDVITIEPSMTSSTAKERLISGSSACSTTDMNELILQLEKVNPTKEPANSPLLNGVWELTMSGVSSPDLIIYQVLKKLPKSVIEASNVTLTISSVQPRVTATSTIKIGPVKADVSIVTELTAVSGTRLSEEYKSGKLNDLEIPLDSLTTLTRELIVTYLDEDLLVVRDFLGSPEVLRRAGSPKLSPSTTLNVPSASDEEGAPGS